MHSCFKIKNLKYVLLFAIVGFTLFTILSALLFKPKYEANCMSFVSVVLLEEEKELGYNELKASNELAISYVLYLTDTYMYKSAAKSLPEGLINKYSYRNLSKMINAELSPGTFVIRFNVIADNKEDAVALCNFYSEYSLNEVNSLLGVGYVEVFEKSSLDSIKVKSNLLIHGLIGMLTGTSLSYLFIYMHNRFSKRIKSRDDITKEFPDLVILGEIEYNKGEIK